MTPIRFAILTVSDRCARGEQIDLSGQLLQTLINGIIVKQKIVEDDCDKIEIILRKWCREEANVDVILTTGGTGFSPRDVTPEATSKIIEKPAPAISFAMFSSSIKTTPMAMLSRAVSGIKHKTLIINFPGSKRAVKECYEAISPCLQHAVDLLKGNMKAIENIHLKNKDGSVPKSKVKPDKLINRCRKSPWPMLSMNEATNKVINEVCRTREITIPLGESCRRVLSKNIIANDPLPPFRAAIKDGYAVRSCDGKGPLIIQGNSAAGRSPVGMELKSGCCFTINTGAPLPLGADAVIQVESTQVVDTDAQGKESSILLLDEVKFGQEIREIGSDIATGEIVLSKGTLIGSAEIGLLATVGVTEVPVYEHPRVAVISTGDELVAPGSVIGDGKVRDSNMVTLISLFNDHGFQAFDMGIVKDNPNALFESLYTCINKYDVVVTTGSVSMGEKDYLKDVLQEDLNATICFGRLNMKPGKPTTFAFCFDDHQQKKLFFCLPGNPVSALVISHLLIIPALKCMAGHARYYPTEITVVINFDVKLDERPEYRRVFLEFVESGPPLANDTGNQISSRLLSCVNANALLKLPSLLEHSDKIITKGTIGRALIIDRI